MKNSIKCFWKQISILPLICLCGCVSSVALHHDYENYSDVYGDAINKQLLLNLARESQQDPVYFLQLASISSQYQFSTSAGFTPSTTRTAPASGATPSIIQHALTLGGNVGAGVTQTPQFQFLPLNGTSYVQAVLSPIPVNVLMTFYNQGWPADWVIRTMVDSVVIKADLTNSEVYVNDPSDPTYPEFLDFCDNLRNAQVFQMLDAVQLSSAPKTVFVSTNSKLSEITAAIQNGLSVAYTNSSITVKSKPDEALELTANKYSNRDVYRFYMTNKISFSNVLAFAEKFKAENVKFKIRTFETVLNAVANEEGDFQDLAQSTNPPCARNIAFTNDACGPIAIVTRPNGISFTVRPILMITYSGINRSHFSKLVEIEYENTNYFIGDLPNEDFYVSDAAPNRTVFTMISYLFSQVAIDTSKLPVQQLIQVQ